MPSQCNCIDGLCGPFDRDPNAASCEEHFQVQGSIKALDVTLHQNDRSPVESNQSPPFSSSTIENLLQNYPLPKENDPLSPRGQNQEEKIEDILPASAPVPHQSPAEKVIQLPERKNRGKPRVQYEADLKAKGKYLINNYISLNRLSESCVHYVKQLADISVPNSVTEALEDPKWKEAMNEEMRALQKNVTWELVPLSHGKKIVGCRWIYTVKLKADGSVERYKARLVAKGYTQRYGIDYEETFARQD
ncbi:unnamed protein product [Prunus armeniaca]